MLHLNVFGGRNPAFASLWRVTHAGGMHPADITAALKKAGSSQTAVARSLGVSQAAVWYVINGKKKSARIARRVARTTGIPLALLWPGRYMEGSRK